MENKSLINSFPKYMESNVLRVIEKCNIKRIWESFYGREICPFEYIVSGEKVYLPYRIEIEDNMKMFTDEISKNIYACLMLLNTDGYLREEYLIYILSHNIEEYMLPFLMQISGDYVKEILTTFYEDTKDKNNRLFKKFAEGNYKTYIKIYSKMVSYWNEYYKYEKKRERHQTFVTKSYCFYTVKDYIGYKFFKEIWGFIPKTNKNLQDLKGVE